MYNEDEDTRTYHVVMNHEEQYSIWLDGKPIPSGWSAVGKSGPKAECLAYIEEVWTDMRPLSLRKHMEEFEGRRAVQILPSANGAGGTAAGESAHSV
ncbi:MAG: MbtH family protein [Gemmatimonadaceae bacterium]